MKYFYLISFLIFISCQHRRHKDFGINRNLASLVQYSSEKAFSQSLLLSFSKESVNLVPFNWILVDKIKIADSKQVRCFNYSQVYFEEDMVVYELIKGQGLNCKSEINQEVSVEYFVSEVDLRYSVLWDEVKKYLIDKVNNEEYNSIVDELKSIGLLELFFHRLNYDQVMSLGLRKGDFVHLRHDVQEINQSVIKNLKYPFLSPYLLICGPSYPAGNIYFRGDNQSEFEKVVDSTGFNCDMNTPFTLKDKISYQLNFYAINKEQFSAQLELPLNELNQKINQKRFQIFRQGLKEIREFFFQK